jgi:hypothetical protein
MMLDCSLELKYSVVSNEEFVPALISKIRGNNCWASNQPFRRSSRGSFGKEMNDIAIAYFFFMENRPKFEIRYRKGVEGRKDNAFIVNSR